jgi:hypothetical protein
MGKKGTENGQSLVEFVLAIPALIILLFGVVELGHLFADYMVLDQQTREWARYAGKGVDYFRYEDIGPDSTFFKIIESIGLTPEMSAIEITYVRIGKDDDGNAVKTDEDTEVWGRVDEVEFSPLDVEQMIAGHQEVLAINPRALPITWVGVSMAKWHEPVTHFFDFIRHEPFPIKAQAVFRVGVVRKARNLLTPTAEPEAQP